MPNMKIREIIGALEEFAPLSLQDGYDNAGLQIGLTEDAEATGALLCLDVTERVIDEAVSKGCNMVVSHHPLLFRPCKSITGADYVERTIIKAIKNDVTVYSAHTNLDNAKYGVNWKIAEKLGLKNIEVLDPKPGMADVGAGIVGELDAPQSREEFIAKVKATFNLDCVRFNMWCGAEVKKVALCGGAGAFLIQNAIRAKADAYVTGEIGYHRFFGYEEDLLLLELGHYESEQFTLDILHDIIAKKAPEMPVLYTEQKTNPINYL